MKNKIISIFVFSIFIFQCGNKKSRTFIDNFTFSKEIPQTDNFCDFKKNKSIDEIYIREILLEEIGNIGKDYKYGLKYKLDEKNYLLTYSVPINCMFFNLYLCTYNNETKSIKSKLLISNHLISTIYRDSIYIVNKKIINEDEQKTINVIKRYKILKTKNTFIIQHIP